MTIRSLVRRGLRRVGLEKIHHPSFVSLLLHEKVATVFDVGANEGHYGVELREGGFAGQIVSFEPVPAVFKILKARADADSRWDAHQLGVGDADGQMPISVSEASVFSSFKQPSDYTTGKFAGAHEKRREMVPVVRLDSFLENRSELIENCFLKIDTQGFEREVLAGCGAYLSRFRGVQLELPLRQLYADQMLLVPMIEFMAERGFGMAMAKENGFDWNAMRLLELDVLFWRT